MQPRRFPVTAIEELRCTLARTPECPAEGVTKGHAIRMLAPQIRDLQSKGYGLPSIARMLSDGGIVITAGTLKSYLSRAHGSRKAARKGKGARGSGSAPEEPRVNVAPTDDNGSVDTRVLSEWSVRDEPSPPTGDALVAPPTASSQTSTRAGADTKGAPRPPIVAPARLPTFVPREDTKDI
jgi:hypothetical protein